MDSCSTIDSTETLAPLKTTHPSEQPLWKRLIFLIWTFLECLVFSGVMFGWASLVYILKNDGVYADLCQIAPSNSSSFLDPLSDTSAIHSGKGVVCNDQDSQFDLVFTIASSVYALVSLVTGNINYRYGTRVSRILSVILLVAGSLFLTFETKELPWLVFPGLTLLGIGGIPLLVSSTQIANLFPKQSSVVIGLMNGAFDASANVLLVIKILSVNGVSRRHSFIFLAVLNLTVLASTFIVYPRWFIPRQKKSSSPKPDDEPNEKELSIEASQSETNIRGSILSPMFMLHLVWFCLLFLHFNYFVSSLNAWLNYVLKEDMEKVSYHTNVHLYSMLPAVVMACLAGLVYESAKRCFKDEIHSVRGKIRASVIPLSMTSLSAVMVSLLMLCPEENVLYVTFLMVMVFRSFLYTTLATFLSLVFPTEQFGVLYGTSLVCGGAIAFFQYALFIWSQNSGFNTVNKFMTGVAAFTLVHPICQYISSFRAKRSYENI